MDADTLRKATHPFFSAKPAGRQRAMGLAYATRLIQAFRANDDSPLRASGRHRDFVQFRQHLIFKSACHARFFYCLRGHELDGQTPFCAALFSFKTRNTLLLWGGGGIDEGSLMMDHVTD